LKKSIEETLSLHKPFSVEYRLNLKNGTTRMLHARAELIPDSSGEMKILRGTAQDITLLKEKEEHSDKLRKLNKLILSAAGEGIYGLNTEGKTTFVNPAAAEMIGWKPDEIIGRNQHVLLHHSRKDGSPYPAEECPIFAAFKDEKKYRIDNEVFWRKDGSCFPVEYTSTPIINDQGKVEGAVVVFRDITQRKSAERKIQESEAYIRNILNTVEEGFIVVDRDYRILTANKAYCNQVSLPCEEVVGRHCYEVSHLAIHPCFEAGEECAVQQVLETGETHTTFHKHLNKDGERLYVEIKAFPNKDDAGRVISVIESIHNVTERYLLEAEQLKTQKLEAIGTLAGGIAHDFNNLLQGVFGYVSMAKLSIGYPEKVYALLDQAEKALSMSVNLTTQLLTFAKGGKPLIKKTNLRPVIENASKFALSGSSSGCRLVIDQNLWAVEADEGQIAQVIQNIVLNASEAMPDNGQVDIIAENIEIARDTNRLLPDGGKYIRIMIRDTGVGILEKHLAKIFDPYFTTKQKGSGLGLATSYSIIRNHGGMIDVISRPDSGTTFFLYFPATFMETGDANRYVETSVARSCRILVMDDDEIVLDVTREMIRALGHEVELVMNGEDAIEKYMQAFASRNPFDIVILDLTIKGGMGGAETVKNLLAIDPNVKAVVTSGYSENPVIYHFQDHGFSAVLSKPYSLDGLKDCLHTLVN
jgi:PAS domain S-box-containing protein